MKVKNWKELSLGYDQDKSELGNSHAGNREVSDVRTPLSEVGR